MPPFCVTVCGRGGFRGSSSRSLGSVRLPPSSSPKETTLCHWTTTGTPPTKGHNTSFSRYLSCSATVLVSSPHPYSGVESFRRPSALFEHENACGNDAVEATVWSRRDRLLRTALRRLLCRLLLVDPPTTSLPWLRALCSFIVASLPSRRCTTWSTSFLTLRSIILNVHLQNLCRNHVLEALKFNEWSFNGQYISFILNTVFSSTICSNKAIWPIFKISIYRLLWLAQKFLGFQLFVIVPLIII